ncbi:MAG: transcriptional repressor [bacterium]|nr:transcriptional repressor [bacterium]
MEKHPQKARLDVLRTRCRKARLRVTPQRIAVYEELCRSRNHPSAEQVYSLVRRRMPTISPNTVNETLLTFAQIGLVEVIEGFGSSRRYDPNLTVHHHIHCAECGAILDFTSENLSHLELPDEITREFEIINARVVITGICSTCKKK